MPILSSYSQVTSLAGTERVPVITTPGVAGGNKYITAADLAADIATDTALTSRFATITAVDVRRYGAVGDGVVDDTAAIQAAINSVAFGSGVPAVSIVFPPGTFRITNTLEIARRAVMMRGCGTGNPTTYVNPGQGTTIMWDGAAGVPMIHVTDVANLVLGDFWLRGHNTNTPSEGIYFESITGAATGTNGQISVERVFFGYAPWPTTNTRLNYCVRFGGLNANNDQFFFRECVFSIPFTAGVKIDNTQSVWGSFINCYWRGDQPNVTKGLVTAASCTLVNAQFNNCSTDIEISSTAQVVVLGMNSENSNLLADINPESSGGTGGGGRLIVRGGLALYDNVIGGHWLRHQGVTNGGCVDIDGWKLLYSSGGTVPTLYVRGPAGANPGYVSVRNAYLPAVNFDIVAPATGGGILVAVDDFGLFDRVLLTGGTTYVATDYAARIAAQRTQIDVYDATATWTKPVWAKTVTLVLQAASGGGGSGRRGAAGTVRCGGGGGGGGGWTTIEYAAADLPATLVATLGTAGVGGAAITTDDTDGSPGTSGAAVSVANGATTYALADGGRFGNGGTAAAGAGGAGGIGLYSGGVGGAASTTGLVGGAPINVQGGAGGGSAGGITAANVASAGGAGAQSTGRFARNVPTGGAIGTAGQSSVAAGAPTTVSTAHPGHGGGGGGSSITAAAGAGGAGADGGGGGGGGAALNGNASGKGGDGAPGRIVIVSRG